MGDLVDIPQIPEMGKAQNPVIKPIWFSNRNQQKALFELMNQKIERYNTLVQNPKRSNADEALFLLQEIEYFAHFLINHRQTNLSGPGRNWYLASGIAQQPGRFEQRIAQDLAENVQVKNDAVDFNKLFSKAESAGVDKKVVDTLRAKLNSESYQDSATNIKNHEILKQLRNALLYAAMTSIYKKSDPLQSLLNVVNNHIYTAIQAEPKLRQQYLLQQKYSGYFDTFCSPEKKEDALKFMHALATVETHLLNASDEKIIEFYKNNPNRDIIAQKDEDFGKDDDNAAAKKGQKISITDLKARWVASGILTTEQLTALAPDFLNKNDLKFLAAGNNITLTLTNRETGENLILRASKQKLENLDCIDILKNTPAGEYFAAEHATIVGAIDEGNRVEDYTLNIMEHCSRGNLQNVRKKIPSESAVLIQQQASHLFPQLTDFCAKLTDERAFLTDIKLSNFLAKEDDTGNYQVRISDLKSIRVCAEGADVQSLSRDDVSGDITPEYAPPEWDEFKKDARFDIDKFMSYQIGLSLYDFLTSLTITSGDENRAKAFGKLKAFKESGEFDYSAAVFQGSEGQALKALCVALLKTNPKERISLKEAMVKLNALKAISPQEWAYIKAKAVLQDVMEQYKKHNEQFNSDPNFAQNYKAMQTFLLEIAEAKTVAQDAGFLAHALEAEALRLKAWLQHVEAKPQAVEHFYPHYVKSLLNEGFQADLRSCKHTLAAMGSGNVTEKTALLQELTSIHDALETKMNEFLKVHHNDVASTSVTEFAKVFDTAVALKSYIEDLNSHIHDMRPEDFQQIKERLSILTQSAAAEKLAENLRKEALYLECAFSYRKKDEAENVPAYLINLRQALINHFFENNKGTLENAAADLDAYMAIFFGAEYSDDPTKSLIASAQRYEQKSDAKEYGKAYAAAVESNKKIIDLYTKFLSEDEDGEDPVVAQMTQLRAEMNDAYKSGLVSHQDSAETLHKVNLELVNSISYLAGPKLSQFKPVHEEKEWAQLRKDNVDIASPTKKWAHRVLMGVGISLALILVVGTGGVAAAPILAADIASAVSPTIKDSAVGLITTSSIAARAKRVMRSSKKENENADRVFSSAASIGDKVVQNSVISPNKSVAPHILTASHSGSLFHEPGRGPAGPHKKGDDSEGTTDSGGHAEPHKGG